MLKIKGKSFSQYYAQILTKVGCAYILCLKYIPIKTNYHKNIQSNHKIILVNNVKFAFHEQVKTSVIDTY